MSEIPKQKKPKEELNIPPQEPAVPVAPGVLPNMRTQYLPVPVAPVITSGGPAAAPAPIELGVNPIIPIMPYSNPNRVISPEMAETLSALKEEKSKEYTINDLADELKIIEQIWNGIKRTSSKSESPSSENPNPSQK